MSNATKNGSTFTQDGAGYRATTEPDPMTYDYAEPTAEVKNAVADLLEAEAELALASDAIKNWRETSAGEEFASLQAVKKDARKQRDERLTIARPKLQEQVDKSGLRGAARELGIPLITLRTWVMDPVALDRERARKAEVAARLRREKAEAKLAAKPAWVPREA